MHNLSIMCLMCAFQFKLLPLCRSRNVVQQQLLLRSKLIPLPLLANIKMYLLSKFIVLLLALNTLHKTAKTKLFRFFHKSMQRKETRSINKFHLSHTATVLLTISENSFRTSNKTQHFYITNICLSN